MRSIIRRYPLAVALSLLLGIAAQVTVLRAGEDDYKGKVEKLKTELQLTPDQVTKIQQIFKDAFGSKEALKAMSEADRKALMKAKQPEVREKIKAVLTVEQAEKFMQMKKNRK